MHTLRVDQQADRGIAHAAGADGAQEGIFDPQQGQLARGGHGLAATGIRRATPDDDAIIWPRCAKAKVVPSQRQDPAQARL
jgi:hypothetical protein